jgi:cell division protein FtsL
VLVLSIGTVWLRLSIVRTTYEITQTDKMIRDLKQVREQSELRVTGLRSPRRLELLAKSRFGLTQPRSDQVIRHASAAGQQQQRQQKQ